MAVFMRLSDDGKMINVTAPFEQKDEVKKINGRSWNDRIKRWQVPLDNFKDALAVFPDARVDPELSETIAETEARNLAAIETKNQDSADMFVPGLRGLLYDYQAVGKEFLHLLKEGDGAVLAFDMGLGKSITALAEFLDLKRQGLAQKALVVCPASLKYSTWKKEILKWTDLTFMVVEGDPFEDADREVEIEKEEEVFIRDAAGKRVFDWVPIMGKAEYHNLGPDARIFLGSRKNKDFKKLMKLCRDSIPLDWEVLEFDIEESYSPDEWTQKTGKISGDWVWGIKVKKPTGELKQKYLKEKTGTVLTKIVKMKGRDLREVQYQQDVDVVIVNYELFLSDAEIMPKIDQNWVVILDECLPYEARVLLVDGTDKMIGDIVAQRLPVKVMSYNIQTGELEPKSVVRWMKNKRKNRMVKVTLADGSTVVMTENHKVYTKNRGYVMAGDLLSEDEVIIHGEDL